MRCFFGHLELPTFAQLPPQHFFSLRRFQPATETGAAERLSEAGERWELAVFVAKLSR